MFILASHQLKNHPTNQDKLRGWKLADQAYWILLFLFGFSKFGFTGDVQNIRTHRSLHLISPNEYKCLLILHLYWKCIKRCHLAVHSPCQSIDLLPHFQLYSPEPPLPFWWTLSSFFFFPWAASACHVETQLHKTCKWEDHRSHCSWVNYEEILLSAECMHWKCRPETLLPLNSCASALRRFASAKASRVWKSHGPGVSDSFETMLVTAIEALWIRIGRGAWVRMWLSLRGRRTTPLLSPLYSKMCHLSLRFCFNAKAGIVSSRAMMNSTMVYISTCLHHTAQDITLHTSNSIYF